jgi:gamma-tubulin complex component 3
MASLLYTVGASERHSARTTDEHALKHDDDNNDDRVTEAAQTETARNIDDSTPQTMTDEHAEELAVLRETLFLLQGISGDRLQFASDRHDDDDDDETNDEEFGKDYNNAGWIRFQPPSLATRLYNSHSIYIGSGGLDAIAALAQAGWHYRRIQQFANNTASSSSTVVRALQQAAHQQLMECLQLILQLEQDMFTSQWCYSKEEKEYTKDPSTTPRPLKLINLRYIFVHTRPARQRLLTLAMVLDGVAPLRNNAGTAREVSGYDVLTGLSRHLNHGSLEHVRLVQLLLEAAQAPWVDMLVQWVTEGVLLESTKKESSSSDEFFISTIDTASDDAQDDLWNQGYQLRRDRVPSILDPSLIEPAFQAGKGVNYIRRVLQDDAWSMEVETNEKKSSTTLDHWRHVKHTIQQASQLVHSHILLSLHQNHSFLDHLFALKQFLLLGQGDFYSALMDGMHAQYGFYVSNIIYRYDVAALMETALKNTNASDFDQAILDRLQVTLLYADDEDDTKYKFGPPKEGSRTVWDLFSLEYVLPVPLLAIVDAACSKTYKEMFLFLFGVKKVEYMVNATWRQSAVLQHALQLWAQKCGIKITTCPEYAQATILLRQISMTRQTMSHFVVNWKNYLFFEVLEGGWKSLIRKVHDATTLDEVIQAHADYLTSIRRKSMLPSTTDSSSPKGLAEQIAVLLQLATDFCDYQHQVFESALEAADRATEKRRLAEKRVDQGSWGIESEVDDEESATFFGLSDVAKLERLGELSTDFHAQVNQLLLLIDDKLHGGSLSAARSVFEATPAKAGDGDGALTEDRDDFNSLRFLKFQLNCNEFYNVKTTT